MRRIYDSLLLDEGYRDVSVRKYLDELTDAVIDLFPERGKVNMEKLIDDFTLDVKRLFNLGAIVNELLTNVMKYAFIGRDSGMIWMLLEKRDNHITLIIRDNGRGLPEGFDVDKPKELGLVLVGMLSRQMNGSFVIENENGVRSVLEFEVLSGLSFPRPPRLRVRPGRDEWRVCGVCHSRERGNPCALQSGFSFTALLL